MTDRDYMIEALKAAQNGRGRTSPNPLVGAVIVKDGRIIATGWHRKAGTEHAEIHALRMAGELARGATLYVTLEPCSHYGRTAPCAKAIVESGIKRVVAAMSDPNPKVAGRGFQILRDAGIDVKVGLLEEEARQVNEVFLKWITTGLPFIVMKTAMTLDGKIATVTKKSKWITGEESRRRVHELRDIYDGIMVGIGTILADNPSLTARVENGKNPIRIIADSQARTPLNSQILTDAQAPTIIAVTENAPQARIDALRQAGAEIIIAGSGEKVNLKLLMSELAKREITSILVEGGGTLNFSLLQEKLVDKVISFIAPKIIGGCNALTPVEGAGVAEMNNAFELANCSVELIGNDIMIAGRLKNNLE